MRHAREIGVAADDQKRERASVANTLASAQQGDVNDDGF